MCSSDRPAPADYPPEYCAECGRMTRCGVRVVLWGEQWQSAEPQDGRVLR
jgi:hypothetical protein